LGVFQYDNKLTDVVAVALRNTNVALLAPAPIVETPGENVVIATKVDEEVTDDVMLDIIEETVLVEEVAILT
jgi:hypothetical protein